MMLRLYLHAQRLGAATMASTTLSVLAVLVWAGYLATLLGAHTQPTALPAVAAVVPQATTSAKTLAPFRQILGPANATDEQVQRLFELARHNRLELTKGRYQLSWNSNGQFRTYQIELPVRGRYQDVWTFASQALTALPYAALDEIRFKRDGIADPVTESQLRFTLYLQGDAP